MLPVFALTLLVSSALLFLVEPMFAKMVLPILGSSPAVWNTSVLFFQAALLAGYAYAHATSRLGARRQALVHAALLALALIVLPVGIPDGWSPPTEGTPVAWLLALLLVGVGLPFFVLSSTAPLMQRWFASTTHERARDPYFLYRASNLGSAVGLVAYPALVEPWLGLDEQAGAWTIGYVVLVALSIGCIVLLWRSPARVRQASGPAGGGAPASVAGGAQPQVTVRRRFMWLALSAIPASLMLGVTTYMTSDISPVPLLWILPLALYLLSFVVAFSPRAGPLLRFADRALPLVVLPTALTMILGAGRPLAILVPLHLLAFFVIAVVCHGRLAGTRPPAERLTGFYLWVALGGVLGGTFNALIAPIIFDSLAEYPLVMVLAFFLRPASWSARTWRLDAAVPLGLAAATVGLNAGVEFLGVDQEFLRRALVAGVPILLCGLFLRNPIRMGLAVGAVFLAASILASSGQDVLYANRTFFGVQRVDEDAAQGLRTLRHGRIVHGVQSLDPSGRDEPLAYYTRTGPVGQIVEGYRASGAARRVAVVGLGTGSMACYAEPGEAWTFYELDPEIERIARDPHLFTYLRDCAPHARVVLGDARLSLGEATKERYGLLAVDAFSSDAIPVHLITREALELYLQRLDQEGILAFHISNSYVDLHPVLADLSADLGLVAVARDDEELEPAEISAGKFASDWVAMATNAEALRPLLADRRWYRLQGDPDRAVWTDDFSNLLSAFRWS